MSLRKLLRAIRDANSLPNDILPNGQTVAACAHEYLMYSRTIDSQKRKYGAITPTVGMESQNSQGSTRRRRTTSIRKILRKVDKRHARSNTSTKSTGPGIST